MRKNHHTTGRGPIALALDFVIAFYLYVLACYGLLVWFGVDFAARPSLNGYKNIALAFATALALKAGLRWIAHGLKERLTFLSTRFRWADTALTAAILATGALIVYYASFGGFALRIPPPGGLPGWSWAVLLLAAALRGWIAAAEPRGEARVEDTSEDIPSGRTALVVIVLFAVALRVWGLGQGIESHHFHVDAPKQLGAVHEFAAGNYSFDLNVKDDRSVAGYPYFAMHGPELVLRAANALADAVGYRFFDIGDTAAALAARSLNVLYAAVMALVLYGLAARFGFRSAGLLAAFLLAVSIIHNHMAKYVGGDLPMSFFALLAVYVAAGNLREERAWRYILAGALIALSTACKYNGVLTFVAPVLIYLALRDNVGGVMRNAWKPVQMFVSFAVVFFLVTPNLWADPIPALEAIKSTADLTSVFGVPDSELGDSFIRTFFTHIDYNLWVMKGIAAPVPLWLAAVAMTAAIALAPRRYYLWASPILIFILGKAAMPMSAPSHYLHALPLAALAMAVGVTESVKKSPWKKVPAAAVALFCVWLGYEAVQDTSFWTLKPLHEAQEIWMRDNMNSFEGAGKFEARDIEPGFRDFQIIEFSNGNPQPPSLHRDGVYFYYIKPRYQPLLFPNAPFPTNGAMEYLFPGAHDIVTTERFFAADPDLFRNSRFERFLRAGDGAGRVVVWIKNFWREPVTVRGEIGGDRFSYTLGPGQEAIHETARPRRTYLYKRRFIYVSAEARNYIGFSVGADEETIGDIYQQTGDTARAMEAYFNAGSNRALLKAAAHAAGRADVEKAAAILLDRRRTLLTAEPGECGPEAWLKMAGYPDRFFHKKMTRTIHNRGTSGATYDGYEWTTPEGEAIFGPYIPLLRGEYEITARWMAGEGVESFVLDAVSRVGRKTLKRVRVTPRPGERGRTSFRITIDELMEHPVEFRLTGVKGGTVFFRGFTIRSDYCESMSRLIGAARRAARNAGALH